MSWLELTKLTKVKLSEIWMATIPSSLNEILSFLQGVLSLSQFSGTSKLVVGMNSRTTGRKEQLEKVKQEKARLNKKFIAERYGFLWQHVVDNTRMFLFLPAYPMSEGSNYQTFTS